MRWEQDGKEGANKDVKEVGMSSEYKDAEEMCKQGREQTRDKGMNERGYEAVNEDMSNRRVQRQEEG
jgi:hypothetical protein